jgi:plastocyanin
MMFRSVIVFISAAVVLACDRGPAAPAAGAEALVGPSPVAIAAPANASARQDVIVNMLDACDPDTFNAAVGAGTCVRSGGMTFERFVAQLTRLQFVGAWHFAPSDSNVRVGQTFVASNKGGEVHTFTEVADFGGGIVPQLNQLAGVSEVAPECAALEPDDFVAPGGTYHEEVGEAGTLKFQCCIHPWMRLEAKASDR